MSKLVEIKEYNLRKIWLLSDKWFRIWEFSLVLGALYYLKEKTHHILFSGVYWLSSIIFLMWLFPLENLLQRE